MKNIIFFVCLVGLLSAHLSDVQNPEFTQKKVKSGIQVHKLAISDNNRILIGVDKEAQVLTNNLQKDQTISLSEPLTAVDWRGDILAIGVHKDHTQLWDTNAWNNFYNTSDDYYKYEDVNSIALSIDGQWMSVGNGWYIDIYYNNSGTWKQDWFTSQIGWQKVSSTVFDDALNVLVTSSCTSAQIRLRAGTSWNDGKVIDLSANEEQNSYLALSEDYLVIGQNNTVAVYSTIDWSLTKSFKVSGSAITSVSLQNQTFLAVGTDKGAQLFNVTGSFNLYQTLETSQKVNDLAFSNDKLVVSYPNLNGGSVALYDQLRSGSTMLYMSFVIFALLSLLFV